MKKQKAKSISHFFLSAALRGLVVFAVFGIGLYAYAITYPATAPGPVTGVVGMFVGETPVAYTGSSAGSYQTANTLCSASYEDSHVCTPMEMINTYNHNPAILAAESKSFWLNQGSPGNRTNPNNDCFGWTSNDSEHFASVWNADVRASYLTSCDLSRAYACCK